MRAEFTVRMLNERGTALAADVAEVFSDVLTKLEAIVPQGRERALVVTKMQEAAFFAKRGIALDPANHQPPG